MRLNLAVLMATVVGTLATPVNAQAPAPFQFVGFSSNTFNGGQGVLTYRNACQVDFGAQARMCKTNEFLDSVTPPSPAPGPLVGWIRPTRVDVLATYGFDSESLLRGDNGNEPASNFNCKAWSDGGSNFGLTADHLGKITQATCTQVLPIVCCKPIPVPEPSASLLNGSGIAALALMKLATK